MDKNIGKKLDGRYEILELIGTGGMSDVYKAKDIVDGNFVAVKILKKEFAENEEFLRRFRNESRAIAVLSHPNIVKIIDVGFSQKIQFIVMEYIDGETLKEFMERQNALDWKTASYFMVQILRALGHAHDMGIVHRDVKPQNIMILDDGTIKVMDFGIAKFAREEGLTTTAQAIGSVHYISPEQARSDATDEKSDIYSAGIVFYEMLTGVKPFDNENPVSVALMHMQAKAKRPCDINPDIPKGLEEIILKAIEKEPNDRYAKASLMIDDIEKFKSYPDETFGYYEEEEIYMEHDNQNNNNENESNTRYFKPLDSERFGRKKVRAKIEEEEQYDDVYDDDEIIEEEYVEKRSMFIPILAGAVIVIIIIAVVFLAGLMYNYFGGDGSDNKEFPLTNFVGFDYDYVKKEYNQYLIFEVNDRVYSSDEENTIIAQDVDPGTIVKPGKKVGVTLSKGPKMVAVPTIDSSFSLEQAKDLLNDYGFAVQEKYNYHDTIKNGYVIKTEPAANTQIREGSTVLLYVSRGKVTTNVTVPDVQGKKEADARKILEDLDLKVFIQQRNSTYPEGTVVSQSHTPNDKAETGTEITLWVSTGEPPKYTHTIEINFPENTSGVFKFQVYIDGKIEIEAADVNAAYTSRKTLDITSSGTKKNITVMLINQANNQSAEIGRYLFSFDDAPSKQIISENVAEAFKSVGGIKTSVATTPAPIVTTPPPVITPAPETDPPEPVTEEPNDEPNDEPSGEPNEPGNNTENGD